MLFDFYCPRCNLIVKDLKLTAYQNEVLCLVCKKCNVNMEKTLYANEFILKGQGWPGKDSLNKDKK